MGAYIYAWSKVIKIPFGTVFLKINLLLFSLMFLVFYLWLSLQLWQPSEFNTYYDIEAVYHCLKREYGVKQEELILYGQSVGSGPTLHLASKLQKLRGVVLHSAILSGIRVLYPVKMTFWFDIFKVSFASVFIILTLL